jgi:hypothetical protein
MAKTWYTKAAMDALLALKANIADAVGLAGGSDLPVVSGSTAFQGTANIAARSDHRHPTRAAVQYPVGQTHTTASTYSFPLGRVEGTSIGNAAAPMTPFPVPRPFTLTDLILYINTAADAGTYSVALYGSNTVGVPQGAPLWSSTHATAVGAGTRTHTGINVALTADKYWLAFGALNFTTTRPLPGCTGNGTNPYAQSMVPNFESSTINQPSIWVPGYSESVGTWPTIAAGVDFPAGRNANSIWTYGVKGTLL